MPPKRKIKAAAAAAPASKNAERKKKKGTVTEGFVPEVSRLEYLFNATVISGGITREEGPRNVDEMLITHKGFIDHLAATLHGMYLVTHTQLAQIGSVSVTVPSSSTLTGSTAPVSNSSLGVSYRWLQGVTNYCGFSVTLDDVARVAMAYPSLFSIKWSLRSSVGTAALSLGPFLASADQRLAASSGHKDAKTTNSAFAGTKRSRSAESQEERRPRSRGVVGGEDLKARVYLLALGVPSLQEAESYLRDTLKSQGNAAAQKRWREAVSQCTAFDSYLAQMREAETESAAASSSTSAPGAVLSEVAHRQMTTGFNEDPDASMETATAAANSEVASAMRLVSDDELLSHLSPELRSSLSVHKLQSVLTQMRRDHNRDVDKELREIERRQVRERVLATYELVRALFGQKRDTYGAVQLLEALDSESRYGVQGRSLQQLAELLSLRGSGLSAVTATEANPLTLLPVASFGALPRENMSYVLIRLDRTVGSIQHLLKSLEEEPL